LSIIFTEEASETARLPVLTNVLVGIIGLVGLYLFLFDALRWVKKNTFVILGDKVLVPGQWYYLWPFITYDLDVFEKEKDWKTDPIVVYTQDGDLFARIKARVTFRLPDRSSIKGHSVIAKILSESITERIRKTAKDFALGKTASEILDKRTFVPLGLNLPFDGSVEITFIGLSTDK
jgi:regulator of protease activity HflC (stomatin/prohibitin superfamily)